MSTKTIVVQVECPEEHEVRYFLQPYGVMHNRSTSQYI